MDPNRDAYKVLQVDASADSIVIQAAYRVLARRYHPDGDSPDARRMAQINAAYGILRDADRRRAYDVRRAMTRSQPVPMADGQRRVDAWVPRYRDDVVGPVVLDFGRYAGWSIKDLVRHDPDYLRWLCRHSSGLRFRDAIARVLPSEPDLERRANSVA
ncbi:MAG: DnaJ domain-containing protein [Candidatus Limnocylindria bacterium]